jgi:hypothetical protein
MADQGWAPVVGGFLAAIEAKVKPSLDLMQVIQQYRFA